MMPQKCMSDPDTTKKLPALCSAPSSDIDFGDVEVAGRSKKSRNTFVKKNVDRAQGFDRTCYDYHPNKTEDVYDKPGPKKVQVDEIKGIINSMAELEGIESNVIINAEEISQMLNTIISSIGKRKCSIHQVCQPSMDLKTHMKCFQLINGIPFPVIQSDKSDSVDPLDGTPKLDFSEPLIPQYIQFMQSRLEYMSDDKLDRRWRKHEALVFTTGKSLLEYSQMAYNLLKWKKEIREIEKSEHFTQLACYSQKLEKKQEFLNRLKLDIEDFNTILQGYQNKDFSSLFSSLDKMKNASNCLNTKLSNTVAQSREFLGSYQGINTALQNRFGNSDFNLKHMLRACGHYIVMEAGRVRDLAPPEFVYLCHKINPVILESQRGKCAAKKLSKDYKQFLYIVEEYIKSFENLKAIVDKVNEEGISQK